MRRGRTMKLKACAVSMILFSLFVGFYASEASGADIIIDNGAAGTSYTGSWSLSGGTAPYGGSSLWSRNGATYTFSMNGQQAGTYEVLMWWSGWSSRAPAVPITVNYSGGTKNLTVNQLENAGQWNSLGTYYFDGSGSVTITAATGDTLSTCADAVQFRYVPGQRRERLSSTIAIIPARPGPARGVFHRLRIITRPNPSGAATGRHLPGNLLRHKPAVTTYRCGGQQPRHALLQYPSGSKMRTVRRQLQ